MTRTHESVSRRSHKHKLNTFLGEDMGVKTLEVKGVGSYRVQYRRCLPLEAEGQRYPNILQEA